MLRALRIAGLVSLSVACASPDKQPEVTGNDVPGPTAVATPPPPATAAPSASTGQPAMSDVITIKKQTQATIGDSLRIAAAAFWEAEYTGEDGKRQTGLTAGLWIYQKGQPEKDQTVRVHVGQVLTVAGWRIDVMSIDKQAVTIAAKKSD